VGAPGPCGQLSVRDPVGRCARASAVQSSEVSAPVPALATSFDPASLLGTVLDGRYELIGHLASGGMGAVFRARHVHLRKDVAVKVLRPELCTSPDLVERFRREAEIAGALAHENIVRVTDFGRSEDGLLYLVMELLEGESLFALLRRERILAPARAVTLLNEMCAGLEAAHRLGVVHRDLKPENIFLARTPSGREVVKLLDFGIAKFVSGDVGSTQAGVVVGTPEYLSPEQAMGLPVDARADVYTVGLIAFRLLTGRHPFQAEDARGLLLLQARCPVPPLAEASPELRAWPALCQVVDTACDKDPKARPPSASALGGLLAEALGPAFVAPARPTPTRSSGEVLGVPGSLASRPWPRPVTGRHPALPRRRRLLLRGGAALAAFVLLGLAGMLAARTFPERPADEARALLRRARAPEALAVVQAALGTRAGDPKLRLLRARALLGIPGRSAEALEDLAAAQAEGLLEPEDYQALSALLGDERSLADRSARLLREASREAVPTLAAAATGGSPVQRLRALAILRDLGAEDIVDRVAAYGALLSDADCDVRRAAARRLGELGDRAALPALRNAAALTRSERRFLLGTTRVPACGAGDASEALKRIRSAN